MAKLSNNNQSHYNETPEILSKGMNKDTNQEFQPEGTYSFALNAVLISDIGEQLSLINEEGNTECVNLAPSVEIPNVNILGNCLLSSGVNVIFTNFDTYSAIGLQYEDCTVKWLIQSECLNFTKCDAIDSEYKIQNGCDLIIYLTDDKTKYKSINLDRLNTYVKPGYDAYDNITTNPSSTKLDPNIPISGVYGWDCTLFNFNPDYNVPDIRLKNISTGGRLRIGTYFISLRYLDESLNSVNWIAPIGPIHITIPNNTFSKEFRTGGILGSSNDGYHYTEKAIELALSNLDIRYKFFQLAVIEYTQGNDTNNLTFISQTYSINNTEQDITIYNLTPSSGWTPSSLSDIVIPNVYIDIVKAHTQIDNRLILGNLTNIVADWAKFQQSANNIGVEYFTFYKYNQDVDCENELIVTLNDKPNGVYPYPDLDLTFTETNNSTDYSDCLYIDEFKTFMRDEVYSLAVVYIFKDGRESPAFHIPGREAITSTNPVVIDGFTYDINTAHQEWGGDYDRDFFNPTINGPIDSSNIDLLSVTEWDNYMISYSQSDRLDFNTTSNESAYQQSLDRTNYIVGLDCNSSPRWKTLNTSVKRPKPHNHPNIQIDRSDIEVYSIGAMGYYETDVDYPDSICDGQRIFPEGKIRHHKMPDSRKEPIFLGKELDTDITNPVTGEFIRWKERKDYSTFYPLGLKFSNIQIPEEYINDIVGYYIVRGDRQGNKTIIDKGWLNINHATNYSILGSNPVRYDSDIKQNLFMMMPNFINQTDNGNDPYFYAKNFIEFYSPKSSFNELTKLGGNYYKIENTIASGPIFNLASDNRSGTDNQDGDRLDGPDSFKLEGKCFTRTMFLPRNINSLIYDSSNNSNRIWSLNHTLPIIGSEYTLYNQYNVSQTHPNGVLVNSNYRQTIMLSKIYEQVIDTASGQQLRYFNAPIDYPTLSSGNVQPIGFSSGDIYKRKYTLNQWISNGGGSPEDYDSGYIGNDVNYYFSHYFYYAALKTENVVFRKLEDIRYIKCNSNPIRTLNSTSCAVLGGDTFITKQVLNKFYYRDTNGGDSSNNSSNDGKLSSSIIEGYVESEINSYFRHKEQGDDYYVFPFNTQFDTVSRPQQELHEGLREDYEVLNKYRLDYSADNRNRLFFGLSDVYNYCSECRENFPNTIRYSEVSLTNQVNDFYKIFLENSVHEIPSYSGQITNLFTKQQNLFVHTTSNLFRYNIGTQNLKTETDTIQLGASSILDTKPQPVFDNQQGFSRGGTEFKFASIYCGDNYIWVDNISGTVYSLKDGAEIISNIGMNRWFRNNIKLELREQWKTLWNNTRDYPILNTSCEGGIGFIACYDPQYQRYILHKRDFKLTDEFIDNLIFDPYNGNPPTTDPTPYIIANYYYNINGIFIATTTSKLEMINLDDFNISDNKSWTISFSLIHNCWVSFHSYRPNALYNNNQTFFSSITTFPYNRYLWKHNVRNYQTYYNNKFDFIIDYISSGLNPYYDNSFDSIGFTSNVFSWNNNNQYWKEEQFETFYKTYVYNNNQIMNERNILDVSRDPYGQLNFDINNITIHKDRNIWKLNGIRDYSNFKLVNTESMFTNSRLEPTYTNYFSQGIGYIDYVINPLYVDLSKNVYDLERFTDKYLNIRLFFKPIEDYKIVMNLLSSTKRIKE